MSLIGNLRSSLELVIALAAAMLVICGPAHATDQQRPGGHDTDRSVQNCSGLADGDFSSIEDAPARVMSATWVPSRASMPSHCDVEGYVAPSDGFELKLPAPRWTGIFVEVGCGGLCGSPRADPVAVAWCNVAVRRGDACIVTDRGHETSLTRSHSTGADGLWAYENLLAKLDYGRRAAHVAALAGKAIAQRFYHAKPAHSYFMGCSGGGREGLMEAVHYPWDFNGIVVLSPGPDLMKVHMTMLWDRLVTTGADGKPLLSSTDLHLLHNAVLAECDAKDGLKDGIIGDPRTCDFDPAVLLCKPGHTTGCLTAAKVSAVRKVYSGPVTSKGVQLFYGSMPGSELGSAFLGSRYSTDFFRYLAFLPDVGPAWKAKNFNFDTDYERFGTLDSFYNPTNPDLREFKATGGKLIIIQAWQDSGVPIPLDTIDYYETVERTMGGAAATQQFARLFAVPGMNHCMGGPGTNGADYLGYLRRWVERGRAPDMIVTYHSNSKDPADYVRDPAHVKGRMMTRPVYPYPVEARYKGVGDPDDYRSFRPSDPGMQ